MNKYFKISFIGIFISLLLSVFVYRIFNSIIFSVIVLIISFIFVYYKIVTSLE